MVFTHIHYYAINSCCLNLLLQISCLTNRPSYSAALIGWPLFGNWGTWTKMMTSEQDLPLSPQTCEEGTSVRLYAAKTLRLPLKVYNTHLHYQVYGSYFCLLHQPMGLSLRYPQTYSIINWICLLASIISTMVYCITTFIECGLLPRWSYLSWKILHFLILPLTQTVNL